MQRLSTTVPHLPIPLVVGVANIEAPKYHRNDPHSPTHIPTYYNETIAHSIVPLPNIIIYVWFDNISTPTAYTTKHEREEVHEEYYSAQSAGNYLTVYTHRQQTMHLKASFFTQQSLELFQAIFTLPVI